MSTVVLASNKILILEIHKIVSVNQVTLKIPKDNVKNVIIIVVSVQVVAITVLFALRKYRILVHKLLIVIA